MGNQATRDQCSSIQNYVLRPKRQVYNPSQLGPAEFTFGGIPFHRMDFCLRNFRGLLLQCSHWKQREDYLADRGPRHYRPPVVVYCHCNAGSRLESFDVLTWALEHGASFFSFDFAGCGISQGEQVSLGWFEQHDLSSVIDYLRQHQSVGSILVWGRSMGAVTSMLYGDRTRDRPVVSGMVLDSPFADFSTVAFDIVESRTKPYLGATLGALPGYLLPPFIAMFSSSIQRAAGFDPSKLDLLRVAGRATIPALFVVAEDDDFVPPRHGRCLYSAYGAATGLLQHQGGHNTRRPIEVYETASKFLEPLLARPVEARRPIVRVKLNGFKPPWEPPCGETAEGWLGSLLSFPTIGSPWSSAAAQQGGASGSPGASQRKLSGTRTRGRRVRR